MRQHYLFFTETSYNSSDIRIGDISGDKAQYRSLKGVELDGISAGKGRELGSEVPENGLKYTVFRVC